MAKTELNLNIDNFFESLKSEKVSITPEYVNDNLDIESTNEYGNILHAIVNYHYDEEKVLETIKTLLDMGVNPNYQGELTGYTFIHLLFYGYTYENRKGIEIDKSYTDSFIKELITLAVSYGFNPNILDKDEEKPVISAIASEVYSGNIIDVLPSFGPSLELTEKDIEKYDEYLEEAKTNKTWHKRLESTRDAFIQYVKRLTYNSLEVSKEIEDKILSLEDIADSSVYEEIKNNYKVIINLISCIESLLAKKEEMEEDTTDLCARKDNAWLKILQILELQVTIIEANPNTKDIEEILNIVSSMSLNELTAKLEIISENYQEYLSHLRERANNVSTINQGDSFLKEIDNCEIFTEIESIINEKKEGLTQTIDKLKQVIEYKKEVEKSVKKIIKKEQLDDDTISYNDLTQKELEEIIENIEAYIDELKISISNYIASQYQHILNKVLPIMVTGIINENDLSNIFEKSISDSKVLKNDING